MVKLFVGGLPEGVDSVRLRQLFSQFVIVNECDVIKDYAFVHVAEETDARTAIEKLDGYILEGKAINIRRSTSKLRREPGMDKRCFRCGAADHKTPNCPSDPSNLRKRTASATDLAGSPDLKRLASDTSSIDGTTSFGTPLAGPQGDPDPELPRPLDSDLFPLYEQYMESRTKYFYYRDRLTKEVKARAHAIPAASIQAPYATSYTTPTSSSNYLLTQSAVPPPPVTYPSTHFYANAMGSYASTTGTATVGSALPQTGRLY